MWHNNVDKCILTRKCIVLLYFGGIPGLCVIWEILVSFYYILMHICTHVKGYDALTNDTDRSHMLLSKGFVRYHFVNARMVKQNVLWIILFLVQSHIYSHLSSRTNFYDLSHSELSHFISNQDFHRSQTTAKKIATSIFLKHLFWD